MTRQGTLAVSRGARDLVKQVATLGREVTPSQLHPGFYGVALRKRMHGHHVQFFRVFRNFTGATIIQHVGGNERNKVRSAHHKPEDFLRGVIMIATVD
jgi:uncharacterized MAPEG superfamily protein